MLLQMKRTDGQDQTPGGYPLPLSGKPITNSPIIGQGGKEYPEYCHHKEEPLDDNEIRITCCGSGNPFVRRAQAATSWLIELGNGDKFVFDVGGGSVSNLWSLEISPAEIDKLFLTHLHLDHVGDFHVMYDALGWARNSPLHVWGPSGYTEEMGTAYFCDLMHKAALWHDQSKSGVIPSGGMRITPHEFDYSRFGPENPQLLVYDDNAVQIYAFPVVHVIYGTVGYRLEWNGLAVSLHADGAPNTFEAEQAKGVDVMMHEVFPDANTFSQIMGMPIQAARNVTGEHTTGNMLGKLLSIAQPRLGVGYHYMVNDQLIDPLFDLLTQTWEGPFVLAQDLMVINLTHEQIVTRMAETDPLHFNPPIPQDKMGDTEIGERSEAVIPEWIRQTVIKE